MTLDNVTALINDLGIHKRLTVSTALAPFQPERIADPTATFEVAVSTIWKWYSEQIYPDIQFLQKKATPEEKTKLASFKRVLDNQRHDQEHANFERRHQAQAWRAKHASRDSSNSTDRALVDALLAELETALEVLCAIVMRVRQDPRSTNDWKQLVSTTPETEIQAVFADIGRLGIKPGPFNYAVRTFAKHPKLRDVDPADRANIAIMVALQVGFEPLSVHYAEILDEFNLISAPQASALLIVAHGVEAAGHRGEPMMDVLRATWPKISKAP